MIEKDNNNKENNNYYKNKNLFNLQDNIERKIISEKRVGYNSIEIVYKHFSKNTNNPNDYYADLHRKIDSSNHGNFIKANFYLHLV
jgi:hypothetical protein